MNKDENLNIEYKREFIDDIKNEIIAFLNTSGGKIFVGINNDKTTYKTFDAIERDQIDLKIGNWMEDAICPSTFGLVKHSFDDSGRLIIQVLEGTNKPYYLKEKGPKPFVLPILSIKSFSFKIFITLLIVLFDLLTESAIS